MIYINKYGISLRTAREKDAELILSFRNDEKNKRFISKTDADVDEQRLWLRKYEEKENQKIEFYFIATDEFGEDFATYRIYNMSPDYVEIGSWVSKPNYLNSLNPIKLDIAVKEYVFEELGYKELYFDVRRENKTVLRYHRLFGPEVIKENELDIYFKLTKNIFQKNRAQIFKRIK
ncbi:GNAT family N-acetyltransferase [Sphingobacterium siyangense]|uniref:GNAT family N-acetyltransferase n=1 Tax=Sphingobacterium TaxID=28453 RepID=UPI00200BAEF2|nr:GNAT family N-acetyltransferase [Sphingobacterium siyangense]UQA75583.1 GNAT family N-acetyltransferase [Sphingobacterium siyangense]